jgi:hypothetical protein
VQDIKSFETKVIEAGKQVGLSIGETSLTGMNSCKVDHEHLAYLHDYSSTFLRQDGASLSQFSDMNGWQKLDSNRAVFAVSSLSF